LEKQWNKLRSWNGSVADAYEELCCQVARQFPEVPPHSSFHRNGKPDGGVEAYWTLQDGSQWGWQAKFFDDFDKGLSAVNSSIEEARINYSSLCRYFVCMPYDLSAGREKQKSNQTINTQRKKWDAFKQKWETSVPGLILEYWGSSEIFDFLHKEENAGRSHFWFNDEFLTKKQLRNWIDEVIANVGPRYSSEINVSVPISKVFSGFLRKETFFSDLTEHVNRVKVAYPHILKKQEQFKTLKNKITKLDQTFSKLDSVLEIFKTEEAKTFLDFNSIQQKVNECISVIYDCYSTIRDLEQKKKEESKTSPYGYDPYQDFSHSLGILEGEFRELDDFLHSIQAKASNYSSLVLCGEAGVGKTHILCDLAKEQIDSSIPALLFLGEQFRADDPWIQILNKLGLPNKKEILLGALEAAAEASKQTSIIIIDALNEGEAKKIWKSHLPGMIEAISRYPRVKLILSVRDSYIPLILPEELEKNKLLRVRHQGFRGITSKAIREFFAYYKINLPSVPNFSSEFENPLFLKLLCKGLSNKKLDTLPEGLEGINTVFSFYIDSVEEKLSPLLDYKLGKKLARAALNKLAQIMAQNSRRWVTEQEAEESINGLISHCAGYRDSLFFHLLAEGLLSEEYHWNGEGSPEEVIRFTYEKFADQQIIYYLLEKHSLSLKNSEELFRKETELSDIIFKDEYGENQGLIEALSLQIPERIGKELIELNNEFSELYTVNEAFVKSLIWRKPDSFFPTTDKCINEHILGYEDLSNELLTAFLTVALRPKHPYNAEALHDFLLQDSLSERDFFWSVYLNNQYKKTDSVVNRLVEWAWNEDNTHINAVSRELAGIVIAWFLTSSNRFLRDRATKALVVLFSEHVQLFRKVLARFWHVNDPYVLERLLAVGYGCALRSSDSQEIKALAEDVYSNFFNGVNPPYPDILLRDHARGIVEFALHKKLITIDASKIYPPYKSDLLEEPPSLEWLETQYGTYDPKRNDSQFSQTHLYQSILGDEDFSRYVISFDEWTKQPITETQDLTYDEKYESFIKKLSPHQKALREPYRNETNISSLSKILDEDERSESLLNHLDSIIEKLSETESIEAKNRFLESLSKKQREYYLTEILPGENNRFQMRSQNEFDAQYARRWILNRIFELGWSLDLFGTVDRNINTTSRDSRTSHKAERIGKKYQWIAYREALARISDNFHFNHSNNNWKGASKVYKGPWQLSRIRDIDPSFIKKTSKNEIRGHKTWWYPEHLNWRKELSSITWLEKHDDLHTGHQLLDLKRPDETDWLLLDAAFEWIEPLSAGNDPYNTPQRLIKCWITSYLVKKEHISAIENWATVDIGMNFNDLPETTHISDVYLGEYYWSSGYEYHQQPYFRAEGWKKGGNSNIPKPVLILSELYYQENSNYDCSLDESITLRLPCKWLVNEMKLDWKGQEGCLFDKDHNLVAFDPSIFEEGPSALVISKEAFMKFLEKSGYTFFTIITQDKFYLRTPDTEDRGRLFWNSFNRLKRGQIKETINSRFEKYPAKKKN